MSTMFKWRLERVKEGLHRYIEGEELVMMEVKLLVKIAVMMMAPGGTPAPPEARGREPPSFFSFLDLLPRWGVSHLVLGLHGVGGARAPPRLDLSLCLSLFLCSRFCPFTVSYIPGDP